MSSKDPLSVVQFAHTLIRQCSNSARFALDATAGQGFDTLFLADLVGEDGRVLALDIQQEALDKTMMELQRHSLEQRVLLERRSHDELDEILPRIAFPKLDLVMYNLGYLPGSDKLCTTQAHSTIESLKQASRYMIAGSVLSVCVYRAHAGAEDEYEQLLLWLQTLDPTMFRVQQYRALLSPKAPECFIVVKK